jgi:glycosyltransferase involved in cell wall biosynthesis
VDPADPAAAADAIVALLTDDVLAGVRRDGGSAAVRECFSFEAEGERLIEAVRGILPDAPRRDAGRDRQGSTRKRSEAQ